jgi:hypothetical protein
MVKSWNCFACGTNYTLVVNEEGIYAVKVKAIWLQQDPDHKVTASNIAILQIDIYRHKFSYRKRNWW